MRDESTMATVTVCNGGEPLAPETLAALFRTAELARRALKREQAEASRLAERRRRQNRKVQARVRHNHRNHR
jgi:hypothetical protein